MKEHATATHALMRATAETLAARVYLDDGRVTVADVTIRECACAIGDLR